MGDNWIPEGEGTATATLPPPPPPPPQEVVAPPPAEAPPVAAAPPPSSEWVPAGEGAAPPVEQAPAPSPQESYPTPPPDEAPGVAPSEYTIIQNPTNEVNVTEGDPNQGEQTDQPAVAETPSAGINDPYQPGQGDFRTQTGTGQAPVEAPPAAAGPLQQATNALGQLISPVTEQLPEPVQNLTDIAGQPVGGTLDAVQSVANELGQGDIPGAVGAGLGALSGPWSRGVEQTGANIAAGQPAIPTPDQMIQNPANILAIPSGVASRYGPAPAVTGTTEEAWFASLPPDQQAELAAQGGVAMNQAWLASIGSSPVPPPELSNPFDAATSGNPLERAGQVVGAIPQLAGGYLTSAKQGTLGPFALSQAQNIVEDPLTFIPGAVGEHLLGRGSELARRVPLIDEATRLSPAEEARLATEHLTTATEEYTRAGINQLPTAGWPTEVPSPRESVPLYHGSPQAGLETLQPGMNRARSPMSELGVFMTPDRTVAESYAGIRPGEAPVGVVYQAESPVRSPARFEANDFLSTYEGATPEQIRALKDQLVQQGHDGIVLTNPQGNVQEVVSFRNVPASQARNAVRSAYQTAPVGFQAFIEQSMPVSPNFHRGVTASKDTIDLMKEPARGRYKFRNGEQPDKMTGADVVAKTNDDMWAWLRGHDHEGNPLPWTQGEDKQARAWRLQDKKFNPYGDVEVKPLMPGVEMPGAKTSAAQRRADFLVNTLTDATQEGLPVEKRTRAMGAFGQWTNAIRQSMLFNVLNVPRYIAQNLSTNTLNVTVRGGGLRPAIDVWTNLKEMGRTFGHQKDGSPTTLNSVFKHTGMGERPNMLMTQRPYFDRITGEMPKWLKIPTDIVAPEYGRFMASVPDIMARSSVGLHAIQDGYHELNKTLIPTVYDQFRRQTPSQLPPLEKFQRVVTEFLDQNRVIPDAATGEPLTNLLGRPSRFEPMWNPDALRTHLKDHLYEDMPANQKPYPGQINRAVNDLTGMMRDAVRKIGDDADAKVDYALFPWRNSVADEGLSQVTLFHYYMTRQGGFYVSEAMKHPWVASAYGRMMAEMEDQNKKLGGPDWMTGWFQFQQSVGGFSTWYAPKDFVSSLFTMASWQTGEDSPDKYTDLTGLGQAMQQFPFMVHPLIQGVAYELGLLGPDARAPNLTGTETFGAKAIQLLNLANSEGAGFMKVFNAMGVGVDANGNKIPIAPRPLQDLYGTVGHAISAAMMPITGLSPVEVTPSWASFAADVQAIGEQETRKAHPEWDNGTDDGQLQINSHVTEVLADPGNLEYQNWYKLASSEPYQLGAGVNPIVAGLARIASPIDIRTAPEQRTLDQRKGGLQESGNAPMRTLDDGLSDDAFQSAKGEISKTVEGRQLQDLRDEYAGLIPPDLAAARTVMSQISHSDFAEGTSPEIAGQTYTNEQLAAMTSKDRYNLGQQYLAEQGYSDDDNQAAYDTQNEYLADHPDLAAYKAYTGLVDQAGGPQAFTEQMMQTNPSFAQYVRSSMTDHITGEVNYDAVWGADAYLAAQGVRGSQYSPIVGNDPSTAPGGYPSLPGVTPGQPLLPQVNAIADAPIFQKPSDSTYWNAQPLAVVDPKLPMQVLDPSVDPKYGTVKVSVGGVVGYVDASLLNNTSPSRPIGTGTVQQPSGGLAAIGGQVMNAAGAAKDALGGGLGAIPAAIGSAIPTPPPPSLAPAQPAPAAPPPASASTDSGIGNPLDAIGSGIGTVLDAAGNVVSSLTGHNDGPPQKPTTTAAPGITPGKVVVIAAPDGMGISTDPVPTDQTWLEDMIGKGHATVTVQYKGGHPGPETPDASKPTGVSTWYDYQLGHGADNLHHAAVDVSCDTGDCEGTPIYAPVDGAIGCAGYGVGDSGNPAATCGYSTYTTTNNVKDGSAPAHDVTITMGTDPQGNQLILEMAHIGTADLTPGQQVHKGDLIATMGNGDCPEGPCPHTHVEAWGYSPELGAFRLIDPNLLINGYYATHGVDDGITP